MPELPEVETVVRTLLPHIKDNFVTGVHLLRLRSLNPASLPPEALIGCRIAQARRRGKLLILETDKSAMLVAHLRMTGRMLVKPENSEPGKHTRCFFDLLGPDKSQSRLFFDDVRAFGQLFICTAPMLEAWPFWRDLGPEPLEMTAGELAQRLTGTRPLKQALLDQKVIAGIGNIYADESLFGARLSPEREAGSLAAEETEALLRSIQAVLRLSISQCGSSIRDYRDADGNAGAFQNSFQVYGQGGRPCPQCGQELRKIRLGGRATVFCPHCQK